MQSYGPTGQQRGPQLGILPFMLAYGLEAVVLTKIVLPTPRVQTYDPQENVTERRLDLDLMEEIK